MKSCANCAHSFTMIPEGGKAEHGFLVCRRYPPTTVMMTLPGRVVATPENPHGSVSMPNGLPTPINPGWLCGEHAPVQSLIQGG